MPFPLRLLVVALTGAALSSCERTPRIEVRSGMVMGTVAELKLAGGDGVDVAGRLEEGMQRLADLEAETTSYREDAALARLARGEPVELSPAADAILTLALELVEPSRGAFDPTAGAIVKAWGFPEDPRIPDPAVLAEALGRVGSDRLRRSGERIWVASPGTEVDLGGIAKGWAIDAAADVLAGRDGSCLVNVGGDIAVRGTKPDGSPWRIGIQDPRDPSRLFLTLSLGGAVAVATSGDYQRYVEENGVRYHHLLDPETGYPARGVRSVTVIAPTCAQADAWATAAFVLGPADGLSALEERTDLEGVLVTADDAGELVLHETSGFAAYRSE